MCIEWPCLHNIPLRLVVREVRDQCQDFWVHSDSLDVEYTPGKKMGKREEIIWKFADLQNYETLL